MVGAGSVFSGVPWPSVCLSTLGECLGRSLARVLNWIACLPLVRVYELLLYSGN